MNRIEETVTDAVAGYAFARLIAFDTVSQPLLNRVFAQLVDVNIPTDLFASFDPKIAGRAEHALHKQVGKDINSGEADWRQLHRDGWTTPKGRAACFVADLLCCPICVSFHSLWLARLATRRFRPHSTRWWFNLFAGWGAAQILLRLPASPGAKDEGTYVTDALQAAQR